MINADRILTVRLSSPSQINSVLKNCNVEIDVIGVGFDLYQIHNLEKEIDFICIGDFRILKGWRGEDLAINKA